jgi:transcriptional regulator with XRE-family HTH domain
MSTNALSDPEVRRTYEEELLLGEATENVTALLRSIGISQRELSNRLGVSEARVSQIVSGAENLTLRSLGALGWALGVRFELDPVAMSRVERQGTPAEEDARPPEWLGRLRPTARVQFSGHVPSPRRPIAGSPRGRREPAHLRLIERDRSALAA